jgi:hypothetical protein
MEKRKHTQELSKSEYKDKFWIRLDHTTCNRGVSAG